MRVWPGSPHPLGATWDGSGVNFAVFSEHARSVDLCLFDSVDATMESLCIPLPERTNHIWHGYLPDMQPGQLYGFRVPGAWDISAVQLLRPLGISSSVSFVSCVLDVVAVASMTGETPDTVTVSSSVPTFSDTSSFAVNPTVSRTPSRRTV